MTERTGAAPLNEQTLPRGFEDLLPFVPEWIGSTPQARWEIRARRDMTEIRRFYDAVLARADDILKHIDQFPLPALPPAELRLYRLLLALAQAAMAVEIHKAPRARHSPYPHQVRFVRGPVPVD